LLIYYITLILYLFHLGNTAYVEQEEYPDSDDYIKYSQDNSFHTYTETSIESLKKLPWKDERSYNKTFPKNCTLPKEFFRNVYTVNELTIFAKNIYEQSKDKPFLNYLMALTYTSENFIWGQSGLLQSYYDQGIPWISGAKVNASIDKDFAALSSAAGDVLIILFVINNLSPSIGLWAAQEQQVLASKNLLSKPWMWPIISPSNPVMFRDKKPDGSNPKRHTFVLGPITWLSLSVDLYEWKISKDKTKYKHYIKKGSSLWSRLDDNIANNKNLIKEIPVSVNLDRSDLPSWFNRLLSLKILDHIQNYSSKELIKGKKSLRKAQKYLKEYNVEKAKQKIQEFYCKSPCECPFVPALDCI
jgi:hypothetical protein